MSGTTDRTRFAPGTWVLRGAAFAALMLIASGCGGGSGGDGPEETYSGAVPAVEPSAPDDLVPVEVAGVKIGAPEDWEVDKDGGLCMRPPNQDECGYGAIQVWPKAAENNPKKWPKKDAAYNKPDGWATEPTECRSLSTVDDTSVGVKEARQEDAGDEEGLVQHADGLKSHHRKWIVTCENDDTFEVRLWYLPQSDVAVYAGAVDARYSATYDAVAESMDVTEYNS
ncbi:hypothetical protein F4561_004485 [Lipingzhangella halophila]|uniref:Uncharacterized protein n=1 Tax=Lipingzhangella halophila TaxID=1783352 RepID=A0A7W7RKK8_9ACTN|nr:hypothetical protein [Lipingzhangella halophila]MBB4933665.1 hypothetical protein [Lipingzhangella halophila]